MATVLSASARLTSFHESQRRRPGISFFRDASCSKDRLSDSPPETSKGRLTGSRRISRSSLCGSSLPTIRSHRTARSHVRGHSLSNQQPTTCSLVKKVTAKELDEMLLQERKIPMVVDFYATWCGPCLLLAQELEKLALEYDGVVNFVKVDTDEEYELANQLEIRGLPTMVFVSADKSKLATRTEGLLPVDVIRQLIEEKM
eukprot:TRINITY_DN18883_c0_g1_i1.p1 TRINITY_DN18883_c0_g1~~TRINITY_DN18883_c0_g1_i1.p1  ORF type:complete len:201 (+),score=33.76 TRINITY_DN18883_c0_g1_i1:78-680(+)